jgi:hypothetical protein
MIFEARRVLLFSETLLFWAIRAQSALMSHRGLKAFQGKPVVPFWLALRGWLVPISSFASRRRSAGSTQLASKGAGGGIGVAI